MNSPICVIKIPREWWLIHFDLAILREQKFDSKVRLIHIEIRGLTSKSRVLLIIIIDFASLLVQRYSVFFFREELGSSSVSLGLDFGEPLPELQVRQRSSREKSRHIRMWNKALDICRIEGRDLFKGTSEVYGIEFGGTHQLFRSCPAARTYKNLLWKEESGQKNGLLGSIFDSLQGSSKVTLSFSLSSGVQPYLQEQRQGKEGLLLPK